MIVLLTSLWPALVAGLALGAGIGALTGLPRTRLARIIAGGIAALALALLAAALAELAPGRAGLWIEAAAALLAAYLAGCLAGGLAEAGSRRRA